MKDIERELVKNFRYPNHEGSYPKEVYNKPYKFINGINDTPIAHSMRTVGNRVVYDYTESGDLTYRFIKHTNPETFDYRTVTTNVDIKPLYIDRYGSFTTIFISTTDDAMMNVWLTPQSKEFINKIIRFFQNDRVITSCADEYDRLRKHMGWVCEEKWYESGYYDDVVVNLDFN